jgi:hypothetical protein
MSKRTAHAATAAPASNSGGAVNKYSVLLPTYNERQNLPIMIDLLVDAFEKKSVCNRDENGGRAEQARRVQRIGRR